MTRGSTRLVLVAAFGASILAAMAGKAMAVDAWVPIYSTDFSTDPGWRALSNLTNGNLGWDAGTNTYHGWQVNTYPTAAFIQLPAFDSSKSFRLEFDSQINSAQWSAGLTFGIWRSFPLLRFGGIQADFSYVDSGRGQTLFAQPNTGGTATSISDFSQQWSTGTWYHNAIEYNATAGIATLTTTVRNSGATLYSHSLNGLSLSSYYKLVGVSRFHMAGYNNAAVDYNLDNVALYQKVTASDPPQPSANYTFHTLQAQTSSAQKNLVVLVHGANSDPTSWAADMKTALEGKIDAGTWDVRTYDWHEDAHSPFIFDEVPEVPVRPTEIAAKVHGQDLAQQILAQTSTGGYDHVHLIGHSLGGRVVDTATTALRQANSGLVIQTTFLDAYTPWGWQYQFGEDATWAEHYYNSGDYLNTAADMPNAHNIDVTGLKATYSDTGDGHGWPVRWYENTINAPLFNPAEMGPGGAVVYGFKLSKEAGNAAWSSTSPEDQLPGRGQTVELPVPGMWSPPETGTIITHNVGTVDPNTAFLNQSVTGLVTRGTGLLGLTTGSPVWANFGLVTSEEANFIEFNYDFTLLRRKPLSVRRVLGLALSA